MHLVDVATHMQLAATGQVAACVPFLYQKKTKMTLYKGDAALETRRAVASKLTPSLIIYISSQIQLVRSKLYLGDAISEL